MSIISKQQGLVQATGRKALLTLIKGSLTVPQDAVFFFSTTKFRQTNQVISNVTFPKMTPPLDPALGPLMVIVTSVMHVILIPLFAARLYGRIVPDWRVSWDGYFLIAAVVRSKLTCSVSLWRPILPALLRPN